MSNIALKPLPECQAITRDGYQCTRNAIPGTLYCWQHQNYTPGQIRVLEIEEKVPVPQPIVINQAPAPAPTLLQEITPPVVAQPTAGEIFQFPNNNFRVDLPVASQNFSAAFDQLGAVGPVTLVCSVGRYIQTSLLLDIEYEAGNYSFMDIVHDITDLYQRRCTSEEINHIITLARQNNDQLSEGLYVQMRQQIQTGIAIHLADLNGNRVRFDHIVLDEDNGKYYLILRNI